MPAGNDIVAWQHPRCRGKGRNRRFLNKVCNETEQRLIAAAPAADLCLWTLWSVKEAAYKLSCFLGSRDKFHPLRFEVSLLQEQPPGPAAVLPGTAALYKGLPAHIPVTRSFINWKGLVFAGFTISNDEQVLSFAVPQPADMDAVYWAVTKDIYTDKNDFSAAVRGFAQRMLSQVFKEADAVAGFSKDADGIPFAILRSNQQQYISLSHDQQWLSFAFVPAS